MPTVLSPLRRAVRVAGSAEAVACGDVRLSYDETWERCRRLVGGLRALGLRPGDRVGIVGPNCHRYLEIYQAVPGAGFVLVPVNARHTAAELRYALTDAGVRLLFTSLPAADLGVESVVDLGDGYERLLAGAEPVEPPDDLDEDDLAGLFYTGGTTGAAKGVMLTHRNLVANAMHIQAFWPFRPATRWLAAAPMFHAAGSFAVLATVWHGGAHVVLPAFHPADVLDLVARERVTDTLVVPTMLAALADEQLARPRDVSTWTRIGHGGAPCATETARRAHAAFPQAELIHLYGATETAPIATALLHEEAYLDAPQAGSCGQAVVGVDVAVRAPTGAAAAEGEIGEVLVRGPNVMAGYWNKAAETAAALDGGWYRTGDLGYQDDGGFLYLVDRAKDMIVTGGENVYSTEVEEVLYRHPAVLEAAVFGVPDPVWGEAVHAVVVPRSAVTAEVLLAHCRASLAGYKLPKAVDLRGQPLPKSGAGKLLKRELREPFWAGSADRADRVGGG
jgi:long-chain acyl-CoA synthetase